MDYDDLLAKWLKLLEEAPEVRNYYTHQFRYILVDEYQDTNRLQYEIQELPPNAYEDWKVENSHQDFLEVQESKTPGY